MVNTEDLKLQTSAVWISGEILRVFNEFFTHLRNLEKNVDVLATEIGTIAEGETVQ